jgi:hypothetical protein
MAFRSRLGEQNWFCVTDSFDVNAAYEAFWATYTKLYQEIFPVGERSKTNENFQKYEHLYEVAIKNRTALNFNRYRYTKVHHFNARSRQAKRPVLLQKIAAYSNRPEKMLKLLNETTQKSTRSAGITFIRSQENKNVISDSKSIANEFNSFFTQIGKKISSSIPAVKKQAEDYLNYRVISDFNLGSTTPEQIIRIVEEFENKNCEDIFGVTTKMIKFIIYQIVHPLNHIFNLSLRLGVFPNLLRQCRVVPIFKSGDSLECDNYRPISIINTIAKILEKIVAKKLLLHLGQNNLLYPHQYGFLPNRSTEQCLVQIINYATKALNEGMYCIGVYLDLKKAFDVCSRSILLKKLKKMGIDGLAHAWFSSYLSGRSQRVDINGVLSDPMDLDVSVIQGSILGPILFLCYINDFWTATKLFSVLYADDTTCLAKHNSLKDLTTLVNSELQKIANWFLANKMAVNTAKTKFIIFRNRGTVVRDEDCNVVYNANKLGLPQQLNLISPIERIHDNGEESSFKLLGIHFDEYLSFDQQINCLCGKISQSLDAIRRVKNLLPSSALKKLYFTFFHSQISYCLNI